MDDDNLYSAYFLHYPTLLAFAVPILILVSGYLFYQRSSANPARRSPILQTMLSSSIFIWTFLGASLILCTAFFNQYAKGQEGIVQLVLGLSLLASLAGSATMLLLAEKVAIPKVVGTMIVGIHPNSGLTRSFSTLAKTMGVSASLEEAAVGSAFSLSVGGRNIVALSREMADSMSLEEAEAVVAHELSHIRNKDSSAKGLARMARIAFPFDPVIRLVEAAMHRERELLADRGSISFTGKPLALASALLKACAGPYSSQVGAGAGLCVGGDRRGLFCRYPDLEKRIDILIDLSKRLRLEQPS